MSILKNLFWKNRLFWRWSWRCWTGWCLSIADSHLCCMLGQLLQGESAKTGNFHKLTGSKHWGLADDATMTPLFVPLLAAKLCQQLLGFLLLVLDVLQDGSEPLAPDWGRLGLGCHGSRVTISDNLYTHKCWIALLFTEPLGQGVRWIEAENSYVNMCAWQSQAVAQACGTSVCTITRLTMSQYTTQLHKVGAWSLSGGVFEVRKWTII